MQKGEKECPRCAETIKAGAFVCKHCGHEFSAAEVASSKEQGEFADVDRLLRDAVEEWNSKVIDDIHCEEIAEETGTALRRVVSRVSELGLRFDDGSSDFRESLKEGVRVEGRLLAGERQIDEATIDYLSHEYGLSKVVVMATLMRAGIPYVRDDSDAETNADVAGFTMKDAGRTSSQSSQIQYGPLQGIANVAGGCATLWGWVFLLVAVVLIIAVVQSLFGG